MDIQPDADWDPDIVPLTRAEAARIYRIVSDLSQHAAAGDRIALVFEAGEALDILMNAMVNR